MVSCFCTVKKKVRHYVTFHNTVRSYNWNLNHSFPSSDSLPAWPSSFELCSAKWRDSRKPLSPNNPLRSFEMATLHGIWKEKLSLRKHATLKESISQAFSIRGLPTRIKVDSSLYPSMLLKRCSKMVFFELIEKRWHNKCDLFLKHCYNEVWKSACCCLLIY